MMQVLNEILEQYKRDNDEIHVEPDEFEIWKRSRMTKKLQLELRIFMLEMLTDFKPDVLRDDCEKIAMHRGIIEGAHWVVDHILEWRPQT